MPIHSVPDALPGLVSAHDRTDGHILGNLSNSNRVLAIREINVPGEQSSP